MVIGNRKFPRQNNNNQVSEHQEREIRQESDLTHQYEENPIRMMGFSFYSHTIFLIYSFFKYSTISLLFAISASSKAVNCAL
jgi:hypothetical protein